MYFSDKHEAFQWPEIDEVCNERGNHSQACVVNHELKIFPCEKHCNADCVRIKIFCLVILKACPFQSKAPVHLFSFVMSLCVMLQDRHSLSRHFWQVRTFTALNNKVSRIGKQDDAAMTKHHLAWRKKEKKTESSLPLRCHKIFAVYLQRRKYKYAIFFH